MKKQVRTPNRGKAALAAAGALAILIGGGSTFALWSESVTGGVQATDTIYAGGWRISASAEAENVEWWDVSEDLEDFHSLTTPPDTIKHGNEESEEGAGDWSFGARTVDGTKHWGAGVGNDEWIQGIIATDDDEFEGSDFDGVATKYDVFKMVPGDTLLAKITLGDDELAITGDLTGQNLRVKIDGIEVPDELSPEFEGSCTEGSASLGAGVVYAEGNAVWITVTFDAEATDCMMSFEGESPMNSVLFSAISLGGLKFTISQDREGISS